MKKLFFTIVFLSVISFVGISKVSALPVGNTLDNWPDNRKFQARLYGNDGSMLDLYSYDGYTSAGFRCPYLMTGNFNFGPYACYNDPSFQFYNNTSFLIDSTCTRDCHLTNHTNVLFVIQLEDKDHMENGVAYHIEWNIGVKEDYIEFFRNYLYNPLMVQNNEGTVTNYDVVCYKGDAASNVNPWGYPYCKIEYDYVPNKLYPNVSFTINDMGTTMYEFMDFIEWMIYPKIDRNVVSSFVKYEMRPNQKAFISGGSKTIDNNMYGRVYMPYKYGHYSYDYLSYFDFDKPFVLYENIIKDNEVSLDKEYIYYDYSFNYGLPNEVLMLSADEWSIFDEEYPYDTIEFYVSSDTYVDIITPRYSTTNGLIMDFNYKDPITGQIVNREHLGVSVPSDSTFFDNFSSILDFFKDSILNVGVMFSTFYNYLISDFGMFFLFIFSFGILSAIIIMFR